MDITKDMLKESAKLGALEVLSALGISAGEISQKAAFKTYGRSSVLRWVREGKLTPVSIGSGRTGTIRYAVADITAVRASEALQASSIN